MAEPLNIKQGTGKILTEQDIEILKKSSSLSEEEIRKTHANFWKEFPGGKMNTEAFIKFYQLIFGDDPQPREACDNAFNVFDGNHDGVIDFAEYLFMLACDCDINLVLKYGSLFEMRDTLGDGKLDKNELIDYITKVQAIEGRSHGSDNEDPAEVATTMLTMFGSEPDGTLNKEQFIVGCINNPVFALLFAKQTEPS